MRVAAIILVLGVVASCNADFKPEAAATTSAPASTLPAATQPTEPPPVITAAPPPAKRQTADPTSTTVPAPSGCGLDGAVFCETFDAPAGDGGKTGDLDPVLWGVSRIGDFNPSQQVLNDVSYVSMTGCGTTEWVPPPGDVRICDGKMFEALNDGGTVVSLNTYPKQPFDFADRTGTVVFDVSADSEGSHAAWPEFVITDKPVPGMRSGASGGIPPGALNEIGIAFDGCSTDGTTTGVGLVYVMRDGAYSELPVTSVDCVTKGSLTSLNHFEVRISQDRVEVWGTDPGSTALKQLAIVDNLGLTFTKGLVWLNDVHYNARKAIEPCECGTQWNHTFAWDNLAFDGPKTYRDLGFNVPDANVPATASQHDDSRSRIGYQVGTAGQTFTITGVNWQQEPKSALVVLNAYSFAATSLSVSLNGGAFTDFDNATVEYGTTAPAIVVPLDQVHTGTNTITIKSGDDSTVVSNVTLIIVAGAPVP